MNVFKGSSRAAADENWLVQAAKNGDAEAFISLIKHHDDAVRALIFRIVRDRHLLEDTAQETYLKAYRALFRFDQKASFKTWLLRIAYNSAIDQVRRDKRLASVDDVNLQHIPNTAQEDEQVVARHDLQQALARLSPEQVATVMLVDAYGFDYVTAGEIMGVPRGTVASRLAQARKTLTTTIGHHGAAQ